MPSERVRELAREHPQAFAKVANACDDELGEQLNQVLQEEQPVEQQTKATVSAD